MGKSMQEIKLLTPYQAALLLTDAEKLTSKGNTFSSFKEAAAYYKAKRKDGS